MDDVRNLRPNEGISLQAFTNQSEPITIDATNISHEPDPNIKKPVNTVSITPNIKKRAPRRTVENSSKVEVNPEDFIEKKEEEVHLDTIRDQAFTNLDAAVKRKKDEYHEFVKKAVIDDQINRERIAEGLEDAPTEEIKYRLTDLPKEVTKDPNAKDVEEIKEKDDIDEIEAELDDQLYNRNNLFNESSNNDEIRTEKVVARNTHIEDPEEDHSSEDNQDSFNVKLKESDDLLTYIDTKEDSVEEYKDDNVSIFEDNESEELESEVEDVSTNNTNEDLRKNENDHHSETNHATAYDRIKDAVNENTVQVYKPIVDIDNTDGIKNSSTNDFEIDENDFKDIDEDDSNVDQDTNMTEEEITKIAEASYENLKSEILDKVINNAKKLDVTTFSISNKVISINQVLGNKENHTERTATWPLTFAGRQFIASALKGPEITMLLDNQSRDIVITRPQAQILYDHDANPYKPKSLESWAKTIPLGDVDNIYAAVYLASMKGANYIPLVCTKPSCQHMFLTDDYDINEFVQFENDEIKDRFNKIKNDGAPTAENSISYPSVIHVINDEYAVELKVPSLYNVLYEIGSLTEETLRKYATAISVLQYIEYIYKIDPETKTMNPIGWKAYPGDPAKTFRSKLATYSRILKDFDDVDFSVLTAQINVMGNEMDKERKITYKVPDYKCPKCGSIIEGVEMSPRELVFMRQQLVRMATTVTER